MNQLFSMEIYEQNNSPLESKNIEELSTKELETLIDEKYLTSQPKYHATQKGYCVIHNTYEQRDTYRAHSHTLFRNYTNNLYVCTQCEGARFKHKKQLFRHLVRHDKIVWQCLACKHEFYKLDKIKSHLTDVHAQLIQRGGNALSDKARKKFQHTLKRQYTIKENSEIELIANLLVTAKNTYLQDDAVLLANFTFTK